jgi:2-methylcitrate dehydratase PrpD
VECVRHLKEIHNFRYQDIEKIDIETFKESATLGQFPPEHSDGAQYSIKWAVAAAIVDGKLGTEQIHPDRLSDAVIVRMGHRIKTYVAEDIQKRFPEECLSRISIELKDGKKLNSPTLPARGDYTNPLDESQINNKFENLVSKVLGREKCLKLMELIESLENYHANDLLTYLRDGSVKKDNK